MSSASPRATTVTWVLLLVLTASSFGLSSLHLGWLGAPVALGIAVAKAALVALVFMELLAEPFTVRATLVTAVALVALLAFFVAADVVTRAPPPMLPPLATGPSP